MAGSKREQSTFLETLLTTAIDSNNDKSVVLLRFNVIIDFSIEHITDSFLLGLLLFAQATISFGNSPVDKRRVACIAIDTLIHAYPFHSNVNWIARNDPILWENQQPILERSFIQNDSIHSDQILFSSYFCRNLYADDSPPRHYAKNYDRGLDEHRGFEKCSICNSNIGANVKAFCQIDPPCSIRSTYSMSNLV
jgi:hypothetical protein